MNEIKCEECGQRLTWGVYNYSIRAFKRHLCIVCQKKERIKHNPKTGKLVNDQIERDYASKNKRDTKE